MLLAEEIEFNKARERFDLYYNTFRLLIERQSINRRLFPIIYKYIYDISDEMPGRRKISDPEEVLDISLNNVKNITSQFVNDNSDGIDLSTSEEKNNEKLDLHSLISQVADRGTPEEYKQINEMFNTLRALYEELKKASDKVDAIYDKRIDEEPSGNVLLERVIGTSIRDDYRHESWDSDLRLALDGLQNHLPKDSNGTKCYIQFLVDNKWVDIETAKQNRDKIKEVRFVDNGAGFFIDNLIFLGSNKTSEDDSAGQFGEGLKLIAKEATAKGYDMEIQSQNWRSWPVLKTIQAVDTRDGNKIKQHQALSFRVKVYDGEPIIGSKTIFHNPSQEFINLALQLPEKFLVLSGKKPIISSEDVDLIDMKKGGEAFVKGIYLCKYPSLFTYNYRNANVNPDRNSFSGSDPIYMIDKFYKNLNDKTIMKELIKRCVEFEKEYYKNHRYMESWNTPIEYSFFNHSVYLNDFQKKLWVQAFDEACLELGLVNEGQKPILSDEGEFFDIDKNYDLVLKLPKEYKEVYIPKELEKFLRKCGVKTNKQVIPDFVEKEIKTSLTTDVASDTWGIDQFVIDLVQNHLPDDSGGTKIYLRFQTDDERWHDYIEMKPDNWNHVKTIKICDNGDGYDYKNLGLIASSKKGRGAGKFGEGAKMCTLYALRHNRVVKFKSGAWIATPTIKKVVMNEGMPNEKEVGQLVFQVKEFTSKANKLLDDGDKETSHTSGYYKGNESSATIIENPTYEMINAFRYIGDRILLFKDSKPKSKVYDREILDFDEGRIYVKGLLIPGNHGTRYSYNFPNFNIKNRDRNTIPRESLKREIREILENTTDIDFIKRFITDAALSTQDFEMFSCLEFNTNFWIPSETYAADRWIRAFKEKYGERVGIRDITDIDYDAVHRAEHMGIKLVSLPSNVYKAMENLKDRSGNGLLTYKRALLEAIENSILVDENTFTEKEKERINYLYGLNNVFKVTGHKAIKEIKIFDYPKDYFGERAAGYCKNSEKKVIYISRETLNASMTKLLDVYYHEATHDATKGAEDPSPEFRNHATEWLGRFSILLSPLSQSISSENLYKDLTKEDLLPLVEAMSNLMESLPSKKEKRNNRKSGNKKSDEEPTIPE